MIDLLLKFTDWCNLKIQIHFAENPEIYFRAGQIWWISLGQNIGREQNGKNERFERPVIILKKFNRHMFWGVPASTVLKTGPYHYQFILNGKKYCAILSQLRILSSKRLINRVSRIENNDLENIRVSLRQLI
jgi:mRNA interferase MazF